MCIIPARLGSSRLPQKPLIKICGKTMIERTYQRAIQVLNAEEVYIATDSEEIKSVAEAFGAQVLMTSDKCITGTDRVAEASLLVDSDYYINLQGDEPIMPIKNIDTIVKAAKRGNGGIMNGYAKILNADEYKSTMIPKVIISEQGRLMYMSRSPIPGNKDSTLIRSLKQICVYAFCKDHLKFFYGFGRKSINEEIEDIEILRFCDNDFNIDMLEMSSNTVAVDTISDYSRVEMIISTQGEDQEEYEIG